MFHSTLAIKQLLLWKRSESSYTMFINMFCRKGSQLDAGNKFVSLSFRIQ